MEKVDPLGYYAALNLSHGAGLEEVRLAYRFVKEKYLEDRSKKIETSGYRDTELENQRLENKDLNIVEDEARSDGAMMTVDDVRNLLHGSGT